MAQFDTFRCDDSFEFYLKLTTGQVKFKVLTILPLKLKGFLEEIENV